MPEEKKTVSTSRKEDAGKKQKKMLVIIILALVIIAVLAGVVIYLLAKPQEEGDSGAGVSQETEEPKREVLVTEDNVGEVAQQLEQEAEEYVAPGYYTVTQNFEWHFPSGEDYSTDAFVANKTENTNDVYFDLFLEDDMEHPIYMSPVIPLGLYLDKIKLDTDLDAGTYDCVVVYHLVDENQETISTASFTVKVIIEK